MAEFSPTTLAKVIKRATGARVSPKAAAELGLVLEEYGVQISQEAVKLCEHRGAKTVNGSDIRAALSAVRRKPQTP
ncbi:MAG: histone [Candidatus Hadarchaeota archaeon]